ncbi:septum site-determining protein MinC [Clostridium sp. chh4-2]|uniref:septum site-determining protein MinC n=1 Tax=Clostridium sp. chh4-2 TaxID=2067550 RepID=UPI000CCDFCA3|nr:septum site-determining protein MinC [Clostridium sp. chh4-2]PNV63779.1 septum site-determining protein MinC [Clostridium sp. chh4-2]
MHSSVVIKGNKSGMSVYLDPEIPFEQLLEDIARKFHESSKFWGSVQMALTLEGRDLTSEEEFQIVNTITANSEVEILCLIDTDAKRIERCEKALNEKLMELSFCTGQFYKGSIKRGDTLESEASIIIIGDVNHGGRVIAKGNIIVLGELRGSAHAGAAGNKNAVVVAIDMAPVHLRISDYTGPVSEKGKRLGKNPMMACIENDTICIKNLKKSFFSILNSI